MTHIYKFTGEVPAIFSDYSHGNIAVLRANPDESPAPVGSTVVLNPGDIAISGNVIEHAYLEQIEQGKESPLTILELENSLDQLGIDRVGVEHKPELAALLDGALQNSELNEPTPPEDTPAPKKARATKPKAGAVTNVDGTPSTDLTPATPEDIASATAAGEPIADAIVGDSATEGEQS